MSGFEQEQEVIITAPTFQRLMEEIDRISQLYIHQYPNALICFIEPIDGTVNDSRIQNGLTSLSEGFNPRYANGNWHQAVWMSPN